MTIYYNEVMELYHLINRGVDKRDVFVQENDYVRFVRDMFVFNDINPPTTNVSTRDHNTNIRRPRSLIVEIHAFCLMPNHYHMLVSEKIEDGIPLFMKKLNMGYARHFNEKYKRSGALWQGKYKKLLIERDGHFMYIPYYIHLNPLDLVMPSWRNGKVRKFSNALRYLESYRWSSHLDYIGLKNFPSVTQREFLSDVLGTKGQYLAEMRHIMTSELIASASDAIELGK